MDYQAWRHDCLKQSESHCCWRKIAGFCRDTWVLPWSHHSGITWSLIHLLLASLCHTGTETATVLSLPCLGIWSYSLETWRSHGGYWKSGPLSSCIRQVSGIRANMLYYFHCSLKGRARHRPRPYYPEQYVACKPYGKPSRSSGGKSWCSKDRLSLLASLSSLRALSPAFVRMAPLSGGRREAAWAGCDYVHGEDNKGRAFHSSCHS